MEHEKQARLSSDPSVHDLFPTTKSESQAIRPDWSDSTPLLCPPISEQEAIVAFVERVAGNVPQVVARTEREVALIREYRTTLTAEVVTGKLDVREAAKRLPAEAEELLSVDDVPEDEIGDDDSEAAE